MGITEQTTLKMYNILGLDLFKVLPPSEKFLGKKSKKLNCLTPAEQRGHNERQELLRVGVVGLSHATCHKNYSISTVTFLCRTSS